MPSVPFKLNQDRRQHIPRQKRKVTNWREYDAGLRQRGSLTVWFTDEAVQAWQAEPRATRGGQPDYSPLAILTALTLRAVFHLPFRQTEGLIGSVIGLLGLNLAVPDHTTLCRRAATLEVPRPRPRSDGEPVHLLVDSTGLKLCGAGEWLIEKHGTRTRRSWRKLHIGMDADTGRIVAAVLTDKDADDGAQVGPLLDQADGPIASLTGDGAYDQESIYSGVAERHPEASVIVPPQPHKLTMPRVEWSGTARSRPSS
jgi:DDE family transposase